MLPVQTWAVEDQVLVVHDAAVVLVVDDGDAGGFEQGEVRGVGGVGSGLVVGHDAHGDAARVGGDQGVAHAHPLEVVDGGVDAGGGAGDPVEQRLLHGGDGGRGGHGGQVVGQVDGRVGRRGGGRHGDEQGDGGDQGQGQQMAAHRVWLRVVAGWLGPAPR